MAARRHAGPGIAKVRHPRPQARRAVSLCRTDDALWAWLFERADVLSEGAAEQEGDAFVYRGTTSIILPVDDLVPGERDVSGRVLIPAASADPHLRLRAVRVARREAHVRAPGPLETVRMDVVVRFVPEGLRIDIDVDAEVSAMASGANQSG